MTANDSVLSMLVFLGLALMPSACSSEGSPLSQTDAGADASLACLQDQEHLGIDDSADLCCPGLFKACPFLIHAEAVKPCVCSVVECGVDPSVPPPNVPCCSGVIGHCKTDIGTSEPQCVCGKADGGR